MRESDLNLGFDLRSRGPNLTLDNVGFEILNFLQTKTKKKS
jgi:hypothetical protein